MALTRRWRATSECSYLFKTMDPIRTSDRALVSYNRLTVKNCFTQNDRDGDG